MLMAIILAGSHCLQRRHDQRGSRMMVMVVSKIVPGGDGVAWSCGVVLAAYRITMRS